MITTLTDNPELLPLVTPSLSSSLIHAYESRYSIITSPIVPINPERDQWKGTVYIVQTSETAPAQPNAGILFNREYHIAEGYAKRLELLQRARDDLQLQAVQAIEARINEPNIHRERLLAQIASHGPNLTEDERKALEAKYVLCMNLAFTTQRMGGTRVGAADQWTYSLEKGFQKLEPLPQPMGMHADPYHPIGGRVVEPGMKGWERVVGNVMDEVEWKVGKLMKEREESLRAEDSKEGEEKEPVDLPARCSQIIKETRSQLIKELSILSHLSGVPPRSSAQEEGRKAATRQRMLKLEEKIQDLEEQVGEKSVLADRLICQINNLNDHIKTQAHAQQNLVQQRKLAETQKRYGEKEIEECKKLLEEKELQVTVLQLELSDIGCTLAAMTAQTDENAETMGVLRDRVKELETSINDREEKAEKTIASLREEMEFMSNLSDERADEINALMERCRALREEKKAVEEMARRAVEEKCVLRSGMEMIRREYLEERRDAERMEVEEGEEGKMEEYKADLEKKALGVSAIIEAVDKQIADESQPVAADTQLSTSSDAPAYTDTNTLPSPSFPPADRLLSPLSLASREISSQALTIQTLEDQVAALSKTKTWQSSELQRQKIELRTLQVQFNALSADASCKSRDLDDQLRATAVLEAQIEKLEAENDGLRKAVEGHVDQDSEIEALNSQVAELNQTLVQTEMKLKQTEKEKDAERQSFLDKVSELCVTLSKREAELADAQEEMGGELHKLEVQIENLCGEKTALLSIIEDLTDGMSGVEPGHSLLRKEFEREKQKLTDELAKRNHDIDELNKQLSAYTSENSEPAEAQSTRTELMVQIEALVKSKTVLQDKLKEAAYNFMDQHSADNERIHELEKTLAEKEKEIKNLRSQDSDDVFKVLESRDEAYTELLELQQKLRSAETAAQDITADNSKLKEAVRIYQAQTEAYQKKAEELTAMLSFCDENVQALKKQLAKQEEKILTLTSQRDAELKVDSPDPDDYVRKIREWNNKLCADKEALQKELEILRQALPVGRSSFKSTMEDEAERSFVDQLRAISEEKQKAIGNLAARNTALENELAELKSQLAAASANLPNTTNPIFVALQSEISNLEQINKESSTQIEDLKSALALANEETKEAKDKINDLLSRLALTTHKLTQSSKDAKAIEADREIYRKEITYQTNRADRFHCLLAESEKVQEELRAELEAAEKKLDELEEAKKLVHRELCGLEAAYGSLKETHEYTVEAHQLAKQRVYEMDQEAETFFERKEADEAHLIAQLETLKNDEVREVVERFELGMAGLRTEVERLQAEVEYLSREPVEELELERLREEIEEELEEEAKAEAAERNAHERAQQDLATNNLHVGEKELIRREEHDPNADLFEGFEKDTGETPPFTGLGASEPGRRTRLEDEVSLSGTEPPAAATPTQGPVAGYGLGEVIELEEKKGERGSPSATISPAQANLNSALSESESNILPAGENSILVPAPPAVQGAVLSVAQRTASNSEDNSIAALRRGSVSSEGSFELI